MRASLSALLLLPLAPDDASAQTGNAQSGVVVWEGPAIQ
jgi:hypothetical protein